MTDRTDMRQKIENRSKEMKNERTKWVNWTFLITVLFYFGGSITLSGILSKTDSLLLRLGVSQIILAVPSIGYLFFSKMPLQETIRLKPLKFTRILLVILFACLVMPFMSFINALSLLVTTNQVTAGLQGLAELPFLISLLFVALIPAVLEETVYRGVFFQEYRKVSVRRGILLSGFLFGLMHLNLNQFSYAFVMGCVFAVVVEVTDTILSTMILHFVINAFSTVTTYLTVNMQILTETVETAEITAGQITIAEVMQIGAAAIIPTILAVLILIWLARLEKRTWVWTELVGKADSKMSRTSKEQKKEKLTTLPLWMGMLICIGYIILYECSIR